MKGWDSPGCRNLYIRNFIKPPASVTVVSKSDTSSQSTKANDSDNSTQYTDPHIIQKKQSQSSKIQSSLSTTATGSNILKSVRTFDQKNNISSVEHNGELNSKTEKSPTNIDSDGDNYSKNYHDVYPNEIDSFSPINGDSESSSDKDDVRYSLYYSPSDKSSSDDEKVDAFASKSSYSYSSSNEFEPSAKDLNFSKIVNDNGYQRTRKNMKKHLVKQKNVSKSDPEVKMSYSDNPLSKGNGVSRKHISTGNLTFSKEVTRNGFQRNRKNLRNCNLLKQNKLESDSETNASEVMMSDPDSETSKVVTPPDPNKSFNSVCVAEEENSTHDLSTTVSKVHITNIDSEVVSTVLRRETSNCSLTTQKRKKSLSLVEKKIPNRSGSQCDSPEATVPNCNSTLNNTVIGNVISSSGENVQTKNNVSGTTALIEGLKKFTQSKNNVSCFSDIQEGSLNEKGILSSYPEDNSLSSKKGEKSYCGSQKPEEIEDCVSYDSKDSSFIYEKSSQTENLQSNSLSKNKKNKKRSQKRGKLESYGTMKVKFGNKGTSESTVQNSVTKASSVSSTASATSIHPTYEYNSCLSPVASSQSLNSTPTHDSWAPKMVHDGSKVKKINIPVIYFDSSVADSGNPFLPVLTSQVNKFSSTILMIAKRDPKIVQSIDPDQLKRFHDSVEWLSGLSEMEIACELCLNNPESMPDDNYQDDLYEQFMKNALNSPEQCTCEMLESLICDIDARDLLFKVRQFCTSPKVVQFTERFFASYKEFPVSSHSEIKVQFHFPGDFENQPFQAVVKDYVRLLAHKIWPKKAQMIKGQFVIEFAQQNLSNVEIFIVSNFFKKSELLTKQTFISRLTYVAAFSVYRFYTRMVDES